MVLIIADCVIYLVALALYWLAEKRVSESFF
jgi:hypothetical protein